MAEEETGVYIYGILPADVETDPRARGIGDPPGKVAVVKHNEIAALVSHLGAVDALGTPDDLTAHAELLDAAASEVPVLPLRFGAVVTDEDAVVDELLAPHHDEFAAALAELEGKAQYVLKARHIEENVLRELIDGDAEMSQLRDAIRGKPEDATRNERIALGERIGQAIAALREQDTQYVVEALEPLNLPINLREPTHDEDAVHLAFLVDVAKRDDVEAALERLAQEWQDRARVSLLGPMAAYDFVVTQKPGT